jgi:lipocalin
MYKFPLIMLTMFGLFACKSTSELTTVPDVDLKKYAGTWYEIAKLPNKFEKNLACISATYTLKENGKINVLNQGYNTKKGTWKDITGTAYVPDSSLPGQLKVRFFWPFAGDYYIISLADDYSYALVGDPSRQYLWILARENFLDDSIYSQLLDKAKDKGFDISAVEKVDHNCGPK